MVLSAIFVLQGLGLTHCEETSDRMNDEKEFQVCPDRILNSACSHVLMLLNIFTENGEKQPQLHLLQKLLFVKMRFFQHIKTTQLPPPGPEHHHGLN